MLTDIRKHDSPGLYLQLSVDHKKEFPFSKEALKMTMWQVNVSGQSLNYKLKIENSFIIKKKIK